MNNSDALSSSTSITADIANELAKDRRTKDAVIEVINERGVITLGGEVRDQKTKDAAREIAARHPEVVSVTNSLKINPNS